MEDDVQASVVDCEVIHEQHHLAVEIAADLAAVEAVHGRPLLVTFSHQVAPGMDTAAGGAADADLDVRIFDGGECVEVVGSGPVAAHSILTLPAGPST